MRKSDGDGTPPWLVGGRLRRVRHGYGLTQAELAEILGVGVSTLSQVERGSLGASPYLRRFVEAARRVEVRRGRMAREALEAVGPITAFLVLTAPEYWPETGKLRVALDALPAARPSRGADLDTAVIQIVCDSGHAGVTRTALSRQLPWVSKQELDMALAVLIPQQRVLVRKRRSTPKGRSATVYFSPEHAPRP